MKKREVLTRNGYIKDLKLPVDYGFFKVYNIRKQALTNYGEQSFEWMVKFFGWHDVELVYTENGKVTVIAQEK